jgi:hypothetical protein
VKEAIFGAESPGAAVTRLLEGPAEAIDPKNADIRAFGPADPPEEVAIPADGDETAPPPSGEHRERTENAPRR